MLGNAAHDKTLFERAARALSKRAYCGLIGLLLFLGIFLVAEALLNLPISVRCTRGLGITRSFPKAPQLPVELVGTGLDDFSKRVLQVPHFHHVELDSTALGKPGHLEKHSRTGMRPAPATMRHPYRRDTEPIVTRSASPVYGAWLRTSLPPSRRAPLRGVRLIAHAGDIGPEGSENDDGDDADDLPPKLSDDPRDFRARLVAAEKADAKPYGDSSGAEPGWMYETTLLEQGSVILGGTESDFGFGLRQQYFHKCVILLLTHSPIYTKGIILNRPTSLHLDGWPVWFGGDCEEGGMYRPSYMLSFSEARAAADRRLPPDVTVLHRLESESIKNVSTCVIKDIYNISFDMAKVLVERGEAKKEDFWVFAGYAGWGANQLQGELERKSWYLAAADSSVLLGELLSLSSDPLALPRIDESKGALLEGGDGLGTWKRLAGNIGRKDDQEGGFDDRMLREWVLLHLTEEGHATPQTNERANVTRVEPGTVLVSSWTRPFVLEKQYLHKSIIVVLQSDDNVVIGAILNRPKMAAASFNLPGSGPKAGSMVQRRLSFGGEVVPLGTNTGIMPLHHKRELGGAELGNSGVFLADGSFTGEPSDLMLVMGLVAWMPSANLYRQIEEGTFTIVPTGMVPWDRIWALQDLSAHNPASLAERIADVKRKEEDEEKGVESVLQDQAARMARKSNEMWESIVSETGITTPLLREQGGLADEEELLADEALLQWSRFFNSK